MSAMASQITSLTIIYSAVYSGADQRKHQKLRVTGLCEGNSPGDFPTHRPVMPKMIPFDDVIMYYAWLFEFPNAIYMSMVFLCLFTYAINS